jgi:hypothetical protein
MSHQDDISPELLQRLREMESDELQRRLRRGYFADHAIGPARQELLRRGITPVEREPEADSSGGGDHDMVILERRLNPAEANILKAALAAGGVPAIVDDPNTAHSFGYLAYALDGVRVRVPDNQVARAQEILADIAAHRVMLDDEAESSDEPQISLQEQRFLAYTQDQSFVRRWSHSPPPLPGFMWSALLFGPVWFFYRKLTYTASMLFVMELGLAFGMAASTPDRHLWLFAFVMLRLSMACTAEALYYAHARTVIDQATHAHADESSVQKTLRERGGINFMAALGALFADRLFMNFF